MSTKALCRAKTYLFLLAGTRIGPQFPYAGRQLLPGFFRLARVQIMVQGSENRSSRLFHVDGT
jgi:hypothetical protein